MSALIIVGALASSVGSLPATPRIATVFPFDDYPVWAVNEGKAASALLDLQVDARGKVQNCSVVGHQGDEKLANEFCTIIKRKRMKAGLGADGNPANAAFMTWVAMFLPDDENGLAVAKTRLDPAPAVEVDVKRLPGGRASDVVKVELSYDAAGRQVGCRTDQAGVSPAMATAACSAAAALPKPSVAFPATPTAQVVTSARVKFLSGSAAVAR